PLNARSGSSNERTLCRSRLHSERSRFRDEEKLSQCLRRECRTSRQDISLTLPSTQCASQGVRGLPTNPMLVLSPNQVPSKGRSLERLLFRTCPYRRAHWRRLCYPRN